MDEPSGKKSERWWLRIGSETKGPYHTPEVRHRISNGSSGIGPSTSACPEGEKEWRSLNESPEFADLFPEPPPPPTEEEGEANEEFEFDPENLVGFYACLVNPVVWLTGLITTFFYGNGFEPESPLYGYGYSTMFMETLFSTLCMSIILLGGLKWRSNRPGAGGMIAAGIALSLFLGGISLSTIIMTESTAAEFDYAANTTFDGVFAVLLLFVVMLPDFVFQLAVFGYLLIKKVSVAWLFSLAE